MPGGDAPDQALVGAERLTLGELTAAADVSVRTVRYYIAEGLLPPPEGSGPGSAYSQGHLDRLRLIQRFKEAYLPLKEIRRRLSGLSDEEVRSLLVANDNRAAPAMPSTAGIAVRRVASRSPGLPRLAGVSRGVPNGADGSPVSGGRRAAGGSLAESDFSPSQRGAGGHGLREPPKRRTSSERDEPIASSATGLWRRIPLGDEAELVISDRVYGRHRDRIDWLVRWARKVFS